jgi:hypothetical protein
MAQADDGALRAHVDMLEAGEQGRDFSATPARRVASIVGRRCFRQRCRLLRRARLYSVRQGNVVFKMTVAELKGTNLEESAVIDHAIKMLSQGATVRVNIPARIYRVYGRQLTVEGADGSRSMVQLFDYKKRFYQVEAKALAGENDSNPQSDVVRFHQSLTFTDGGSNRSEEAIRAISEVCRGLANPAFGAGLDDPACTNR